MHWWQREALIFSNRTMIGQEIPSLFNYRIGEGFTFPGSIADGSAWAGSLRTIGPAWSLGIEIWFYLLAPWLVKLRSWVLVVMALLSVGLSITTSLAFNEDIAYFAFPTNLSFFIAGILLQRYLFVFYNIPRIVLFAVLSASAVLILLWPFDWLAEQGIIAYAFFIPAIPILFLLTKSSACDAALGNLSYPIYVSHSLVITIVQNATHSHNVYLIVTATISLAFLVYRYLEKPIDKWRQYRA
jgi:peptidoglycan/LPS O-acetylase OafA/YrhL